MSKTYKTGFVITGDASGGVNALKMTRAEMDHLNATQKKSQGEWGNTNKAQRQAADTARLVEQRYGSLDQSLSNTAALLGKLAAGWLGLQGASGLIKMADDYGQMSARMKMAAESAEEYLLVQERLKETAGGTYRPLVEAQELYIRTADALRNLGYATQQQLDITDSLSYLFVTNAASADRAASSINAFSLAIQTGRVTSDGWQSMLAATPTLVDNIAAATGKTTAQVRELGVTGKLALADLTEGLRLSRDENKRLADDMALTVEDALVRLRTNLASWVGEANESSGATLALANSIAVVAENVDTLANVAMAGAILAAGRYTGMLAANTVAAGVNAAAKRDAALKEIQLAQAQVASTAAALRHAQAQTGLTVAHGTAAKAADAHTAALARLAAAQQGVGSISRGLLGLMGGPGGLVVMAGMTAAALVSWGSSAKKTATDTDALTRSVSELTAAQARQRINGLKDDYDAAQKRVQRFERQLKELAEHYPNMFPSERNMREFNRALDDVRGNLDTAKQEVEGYSRKIQELEGHISSLGNTANKPITPPVDPEQEKAIARMTDRLIEQYMQLQLGERAYLTYQLAQQNATTAQTEQALAAFDAIEALKAQRQAEADALKAQENAMAAYAAALASSTKSSIKSLDDVGTQAQKVWAALAAGKISSEQAAAAIDGLAAAGAGVVEDQQKWIDQMIAAMDPARDLEEQIRRISEAQAEGLFGDLEDDKIAAYLDALKKKLEELNGVQVNPFENAGKGMGEMAAGINSIAGAMQGMYSEGERGYKNMSVLMQGANLLAAAGAVLTQGMGDPYTAFARMAAMAVSVAGLGYSVGDLRGGFTDTAAQRQETQGTGSVFGDEAAKSESIANSVDITASATSALVGINRNMLRALTGLDATIVKTSGRAFQGMNGRQFDYGRGLGAGVSTRSILDISSELFDKTKLGILDPIAGMFVKGVTKLLGGSSKVTDQGFQITGGALEDLRQSVEVQAYQETQSQRTRVSKKRTRTAFSDMPDMGEDFAAIIDSIADTVYTAAEAIGFTGTEIDERFRQFEIETQKISTKGLTAAEQEAEFQAVFSKIFDDLSMDTVAWVTEFRKAGEGAGETLVRVATSVQVTEEAMLRLGFAAERISPEDFADLSVYLMEAAGGIEEFISSMGSFVDKFAPESHRLDLLSADMERSLSAVGLSVPGTRDEMWQLMQTLDATTAAGADQIATLLRLGNTADQYYKMLEKVGDQMISLTSLLGADQSDALTGYLGQLADWSASELSRIEQDYRERIALAEQQLRIGRELRQYVEQLRISELSPYDPGEKLQQATEQFAALLVRAEQGDMEAARLLQSSAQAYLQNADSYYGRSDPYLTIFEEVTRSLDRLGLDIIGGLDDNTIERLNQQMLAEQQRIRDYAQQQLSWVVAQHDALTSIEQLLELLPGSLASQLQSITNPNTASATEALLLSQWEKMGGGAYAQTDLSRYAAGIDSGTVDKSAINNDLAYYQKNQSATMQQVLDLWNASGGGSYNDADLADYAARIASGNATLSKEDLDYYRKTLIHGSHKNGIRSVPFDGYFAELHKKERVLTERESAEYNSFDSGAIVAKLDQLCAENAALRQEVAQLRAESKSASATAEQQRDRQLRAAIKTPEVI